MITIPPTAYDLLTYAHDLLLSGWCQGPYAKDITGESIDPKHPGACQFCSMGALIRAKSDLNASILTMEKAVALLHRVVEKETFSFIYYNEAKGRQQHEVLAKFALAAQKAKKPGEK